MTWEVLTAKRRMLVAVMDRQYPGLLDHCDPQTIHFWLTSDKSVGDIVNILGGQPERPSIGADVPNGGCF